jgi:putative transposase
MKKAFVSPVNLTKKQEQYFFQSASISRLLYNRTINEWKNRFFRKKALCWFTKQPLNKIKFDKDPTYTDFNNQYSWSKNISSYIRRDSVINANDAFKNFLKGKSKYPKFKSKNKITPKFVNYQGNSIKLLCTDNTNYASHVILNKVLGKIKLVRQNFIPLNCKIFQISFSLRVGKWFCSIAMEVPDKNKVKLKNNAIGIDIGTRTIAAVSNGKEYNLKPEIKISLKKNERSLERWQRTMSRRFKRGEKIQSKGFYEAKEKVQKLYEKLSNIRNDSLHKITTNIVNHKPERIVIEKLNVAGMKSNRRLAPTLQKFAFYKFQTTLTYKAKWLGIKVQQTNQFFPSSQTCSKCGNVKGKNGEKKLGSTKVYNCLKCGSIFDRDLNAAINLANAPLNILKDLT